MSDKRQYPTISVSELQKLKVILTNAGDDPKYLDGRICPYDKPTRELLKQLTPDPIVQATLGTAGEERGQVGRPKKAPVLPLSEVETELKELRDDIKQLKTDAKGLESNEQIQIIKTRAALLEKIIGMKERINNLNKMQKFTALVIQTMEDELPQDARLRVIEKFDEFKEEEN